MRHTTWSRGPRVLVAAAAALLALGGLTVSASALPGGAVPMAATGGCGKPAGLSTGVHTITSGGQSRTFRLDVPAGYDPNRPYRLVVGLHWWHGTSNDVVTQGFYGLKPLSNNSTIFVAPQGIDNAWPNTNGRDVTFIDDVLRTVESALCIDTEQRFATGFSYGGGMSNALACARADVFRAVAILNGAQLSGCSGGTQPIAYLGSHGVSDDVLNISQGRALRDRYLQTNGCQARSAPEPAAGSGTHIRTDYTCRDGYPVVWIASDSGHQWDPRDRGQQQSWVPGEVWQFFSSLTSSTPPPTTPPPTTPPPTTPPPTTPPPTTPPPTGDCAVSVTRGQEWGDRFNVNLAVSGASDWTTTITLGSGQTLQNSWNASVTGTSGTLTARPNGSGNEFGITLFKNGNTALPTATCSASGTTPPPTTPPPTTPPPTTPPPTTPPPTTPPPTTPPPTTPPPTTPPPSTGACSASASVNQWAGGFVATVRVTAGSAALNGWTVTAAVPPGAAVTSTWNTVANGTSGAVGFSNAVWNGSLPAGGATEFGFQGTGSAAGLTVTCAPR